MMKKGDVIVDADDDYDLRNSALQNRGQQHWLLRNSSSCQLRGVVGQDIDSQCDIYRRSWLSYCSQPNLHTAEQGLRDLHESSIIILWLGNTYLGAFFYYSETSITESIEDCWKVCCSLTLTRQRQLNLLKRLKMVLCHSCDGVPLKFNEKTGMEGIGLDSTVWLSTPKQFLYCLSVSPALPQSEKLVTYFMLLTVVVTGLWDPTLKQK